MERVPTSKSIQHTGYTMNIQWIKKIVAGATLVLSSSSFAGVIVDTVGVNKQLDTWESASWTHNLLDNGFVLGTAQSANVSIQIWDDSKTDGAEVADIVIGAIDLQDGELVYNAVSNWSGSLGLTSMGLLNSLGKLNITVSSLWGDFWVGNSTLTVKTSQSANVPEPGSLLLLSLGLLGLGLARRQK